MMLFKKKTPDNDNTVKKTTNKYRKSELMQMWRNAIRYDLQYVIPISKFIEVLPYDFTDSRYGHDSIRIEGSKVFISHMLSQLHQMLEMESDETRLEISMYKLDNNIIAGKINKYKAHYVLYVRAIQRRPGSILNGKNYDEANQ